MGETDRFNKNDYRKPRRIRFSLGADGNALMSLFAINACFFLILMVVQVGVYASEQSPDFFQTHVMQWFRLPASLAKLSERPWTLLTYFFTDTGANFIGLLSNMIWLWTFGYILQQMAGNDKIIPVYVYGGITGGLFFIIAHYTIPSLIPYRENASLLGANAGVIAVAMATTALEPGYRFFTQIRGGIPIWVLMSIYLLIDFAGVARLGSAYIIAHFGGALAGYLFVVLLRRGKDGSMWMNNFYKWLITLFEPKKKTVSQRDTVFYNTGIKKPYVKTQNVTQQKVDEILDKINQKGYHFLTDEEKNFLKKAADDESL